jgi:predicted Zn-dependent peptidase
LPEVELSRAQRLVWGAWENAFVTPAGLLSVCERAFLTGLSVAEIAERANATRDVTAQAVQAVARERFDPSRNVVVLTGAIEGLRGYKVLRTAEGFSIVRSPY